VGQAAQQHISTIAVSYKPAYGALLPDEVRQKYPRARELTDFHATRIFACATTPSRCASLAMDQKRGNQKRNVYMLRTDPGVAISHGQ
jgi:hypothetical protein